MIVSLQRESCLCFRKNFKRDNGDVNLEDAQRISMQNYRKKLFQVEQGCV